MVVNVCLDEVVGDEGVLGNGFLGLVVCVVLGGGFVVVVVYDLGFVVVCVFVLGYEG